MRNGVRNTMTDVSDYVDARELHPEYTTVPCQDCEESVRVAWDHRHSHNRAFCEGCGPLEWSDKKRLGIVPNVTVRL